MSTNEKLALVTGASRGIGRAIALKIAQSGTFVFVHYKQAHAGAEDTVRTIEAAGGRAVAIGADLTQATERDALIAELDRHLAAFGPEQKLDILINNAGIAGGGARGVPETVNDVSESVLDELFAANVKAPFFLTQAILPRLRDGGRIVNISSTVSLAATPGAIAYAMTKATINSFTISLALELGRRGITVNAVAPGATDTDFIRKILDDPEQAAFYANAAALGRVGQATDIADVVAFLASEGGGWITGQVVEASGGLLL